MMQSEDALLCGLDGDEDAPVTNSQFNRWVARAIRSHVQPLKESNADVKKLLDNHIHEEEIMLAKIQGGIKVLMWIGPTSSAVMLYVLYVMHKSGLV